MSENVNEDAVQAEETENVELESVKVEELVKDNDTKVEVVETEKPKTRRRSRVRADEDADDEVADEKPKAKEAPKDDQIVLFVDHPIFWPEVGKLAKGYNLVDKEVGEKWLDKGWARKASVSEVKKHYGV